MKIVVQDDPNVVGSFAWNTPMRLDKTYSKMIKALSEFAHSEVKPSTEQGIIEELQNLIRDFLFILSWSFSTGLSFSVVFVPIISKTLRELEVTVRHKIYDPGLRKKTLSILNREIRQYRKDQKTRKRKRPSQ